jgi:nucleoside-diphosphate-sugar epimerase
MTDRVLLTGATGLIGRQAVAALHALDFQVIALARSARPVGADRVVQGDLLDAGSRRQAVKQAGADHLLHLAWLPAPMAKENAAKNRQWQAATVALVREFAETGGKRAVCVGSCAEYDWSFDTLHESTPLAANSEYGRAKAKTGRDVMAASAELGLSLAWARVFFCYGPGEPTGRLVGDLIDGLAKGQPVSCTDGRQMRDYLHSCDVAHALARILRSETVGAINVASGLAIPVRDLILEVADQFGRTDLVRLGAIARAADDPAKLMADVSKLTALGVVPRFDLASGVADCIADYQIRNAP